MNYDDYVSAVSELSIPMSNVDVTETLQFSQISLEL